MNWMFHYRPTINFKLNFRLLFGRAGKNSASTLIMNATVKNKTWIWAHIVEDVEKDMLYLCKKLVDSCCGQHEQFICSEPVVKVNDFNVFQWTESVWSRWTSSTNAGNCQRCNDETVGGDVTGHVNNDVSHIKLTNSSVTMTLSRWSRSGKCPVLVGSQACWLISNTLNTLSSSALTVVEALPWQLR